MRTTSFLQRLLRRGVALIDTILLVLSPPAGILMILCALAFFGKPWVITDYMTFTRDIYARLWILMGVLYAGWGAILFLRLYVRAIRHAANGEAYA